MPPAVEAPARPSIGGVGIQDTEFQLFQALMYDEAGVWLAERKKSLVSGRLAKRVKAWGCASYKAYYDVLLREPEERQLAIDLLTTNETYFFREPRHFDFLRDHVLPAHTRGIPFRAWSAACSSGEEVYTLSMVLADGLGSEGWSVTGSDLNTQVLTKARSGHYGLARTEGIPKEYLRRFCLKGTGKQSGTFLVGRRLREKAEFRQVNLNKALPHLEMFDVIFLRNVMIYFSAETKAQVVRRVLSQLKPGGYFFIGHSESLGGLNAGLESVCPAVYRKPL